MNPLARLFAGRFRLAGLVLIAYLAINTLVRLGLVGFNGDWSLLSPTTLAPILAIGILRRP